MKIATIAGVALASTVAGAGTAVSADVLTVQHGDTLSELAVKHHTSVDDFVKKNGIKDANLIITGQKLTFTHKDNAHAVKKATDTNAHYTVVDGDTLSTIAETYHTTPQAIAELNGMSVDDILHIGTVLTVANHAQPQTQAQAQAHAKTTTSTSKSVAKQTPVANPAQPAKQSSVAQSAKDVKPAVAQPAPSHEKKATPAKATSPDVDQLSEVASSAPSSVASSTAPSSVASSAPSSVASSTAPSSVASSTAPSSVASSTPSSVASSAPSSVASSTAPSSVASSAPSSVASSTAPSSVASSTAPSSVASSTPSSVASSAPSSVASSTAPSSVASSAPSSVASSTAPSSVASSTPSSVASSTPSSVASSAPSSTTPDTTTPTRNQLGTGSLSGVQRSAIVNEAISLTHQNIPYVWGGKTTAGFDCSGLTAYVYGKAGASIPSYTVAEESYVKTMDVKTPADVTANAQTGDLLFWGGHGQTYHVAIYIGNGQYIAAPQPGMNVEVEPVSTYFMPSFIGRY